MEDSIKVPGPKTKQQKKGKISRKPIRKGKTTKRESDEEEKLPISVPKPRIRKPTVHKVPAATSENGGAPKSNRPRTAEPPTEEREERWLTHRSWRDVYEPDVTVYIMGKSKRLSGYQIC